MRCLPFLSVSLVLTGCGARTSILPDDVPHLDGGTDSGTDARLTDSGADTSHPIDPGVDVGVRDTGVDVRDTGIDVPVLPPDAGLDGTYLLLPGSGTTWRWVGTGWAGVAQNEGPPLLDQTALASDGAELVLFGGLSSSNSYTSDTFVFSGGVWTDVESEMPGPSARGNQSMAQLGSTVVLFGGSAEESSALDDTWTWLGSGAGWVQEHPALSPPRRSLAAFAQLGNKAVLFGGSDGTGNSLADTWVWDSTTWTQVMTATSPPAQFGVQTMVSLGSAVVLFIPDLTNNVTNTWSFDGSAWTEVRPGATLIPAVYAFGAATQTVDTSILVWGGYDQNGLPQGSAYSWNGIEWASLGQQWQGSSIPFSMGATPCLMSTLTGGS